MEDRVMLRDRVTGPQSDFLGPWPPKIAVFVLVVFFQISWQCRCFQKISSQILLQATVLD